LVCCDCHAEKTTRARLRREKSQKNNPIHGTAIYKDLVEDRSTSSSPAQHLIAAANSLATAGHPRHATEIFDAARRLASEVGDRDSEAEALESLARQAWANADTPQCLEYAQQLLALPLENTSVWRIHGFLRLARALTALGRPREALETLREAAKVCDYTRFGSLATYIEVRAYTEHALRMKTACLRDFQLATDMAETLEEGWPRVFALINYAVAAIQLGESDLGCKIHQAAIEAALRFGGWPIGYARLSLAQGLLLMGQPARARDIVSAISEDELEHPSVGMKYVWISAILTSMLPCNFTHRVNIEELFEDALRSEEPSRIAPMAAAFHWQCLEQGKKSEAQTTLTRTLEKLRIPNNAEWLTIAVIRFGTRDHLVSLSDIWSELLEDDLATAHHAMLQSRVAGLDQEQSAAAAFAGRAEAIYREARLKYFEAAAMELGGRLQEARKAYHALGAVRDARRVHSNRSNPEITMHLTRRQQEVIGLLLRGLAVPEVAASLTISPRTVEHHLSMVMQNLGIARRSDLRSDPRLVHLTFRP